MQKLLIAALLVLAVTANFGEVEESGRFGDLIKKGVQKIAPHVKDIAREVAPVLKDALVRKIKSEINKKLNLDEVEEGQWGTYRDMRYRPRPNWNTSWDQMYRPSWNSTWDRPIRIRPIRTRNNSWERSWRMNNTRRMNLTREKPMRGWNFVEDAEESQWSTYRDMRYRPRPTWNMTQDMMYRPNWNSWNTSMRPRRPMIYRNNSWNRNHRLNLSRRAWNFVEESEESQWGQPSWDRPLRTRPTDRRQRRNMSWESNRNRRRWNSTWDQMARPSWNSTWESRPRPMRNRTNRWFNQTRRNNRTDRMRRPPMNRWNFVEESEESQWGPTWNAPRPSVYYPYRYNRNNTWNNTWRMPPMPSMPGMPRYDRPIIRPTTPQWYNQTWRRPTWNNIQFEETEESQFNGRMIGAPFRRNRTDTIRDRRDRPLRDIKVKDNKKGGPKDNKKGGLKKGEQKGWWSRFTDKFRSGRKNQTSEGKPLRPNRPMRPGMRPRPRLNSTLFL